jgi:hypothetical protein
MRSTKDTSTALETVEAVKGDDGLALEPVAAEDHGRDDIGALAARLGQEMGNNLYLYQKSRGWLPEAEATFASMSEQLARTPVQSVRWDELAAVGDADPARAVALWERIKEAARAEQTSGHRAAAMLESASSTPMERARFLVMREALIEQWQPRGGVEMVLLDQLAQAHAMHQYWTQVLATRTQEQAAGDISQRHENARHERSGTHWGQWLPPRVSEAEAINEAAQMVDRWSRLFLRTLRQLRDLRRYAAPVTIHNPAQVNVGHQQINVAAAPDNAADYALDHDE